MDSLYSKFLGVGYKYKNPIRENYGLSKSTSMPFYSSFQARKLPANLNNDFYFSNKKNNNNGITSSDIKVQMLEEKIKNLENKQIQMQLSQTFNNQNNNNNNIQYKTIEPYPNNTFMPLLLINNNNDYNKISRSYILNNELKSSRLKFENNRGILQRQNYTPNNIKENSNYNSIFNKKRKNYLLNKEINEKINDIKIKKKAKKFVNKLNEEIYSPFQKDYKDYMKNINNNIQKQLKEDNIILNNDINKIENDYNDIKNMIEEKLNNMEIKQKNNFEKLKNVIKNYGGEKMSKAIQNVFDGKNFDLQKAEDEHLSKEVFDLPNIINQKLKEEKIKNYENEKKLEKKIEEMMNYEFMKQREIEELKHKEQIRMMELQQEKERIENLRMLNKLKYEIDKENENNYKRNINYPFYEMNNSFSLNDIFKIFMMKKISGSNNINGNMILDNFNNMNTDELLKYMIFKNMGIDNMNNTNTLTNSSFMNDPSNLNNNNRNDNNIIKYLIYNY